MPHGVGGPSGIPGPPVKPDEESLWIFRAGKAAWASLTSLVAAGLVASRIISTNSSGQITTPSAISTDQTLTLSTATGTTLNVASTQASTSVFTGAIVTAGSVGIAGGINIGGDFSSSSPSPFFTVGDGTGSPIVSLRGSNAGQPELRFYNFSAAGYTVYRPSAGTGLNFFQAGTANADALTLSAAGGVTLPVATGTTLTVSSTTNSTSIATGAVINSGGEVVTKNLIHAMGRGAGVTSTATAAGTTTLTATSTEIQKFTGTTTQTVQFPAANLFGAGIAVLFTINNQSTGTVTPTRAGADTFPAAATTDPVLAGASMDYRSDGVSLWMKC